MEEERRSEKGEEQEEEEEEGVARAEQFRHRRKPSWINESHPRFVWGDDETRKLIREEVRRERQRSSDEGNEVPKNEDGQVDEDDDDDVDDDDMAYGLDPGFSDIDEELRVIEGMIHEHTVIKEVEVEDEDEAEFPSQVDLALNKLRMRNGSKEFSPEEVAHPAGATTDEAAAEIAHLEDALSIETAESQDAIKLLPDGESVDSCEAEGGVQSSIAPPPPPAQGSNEDKEDLPSVDSKGDTLETSSSFSSSEKLTPEDQQSESSNAKAAKKRVRLVELPDFLAMVAREHQRQLLEKQKRDLILAAQAANAREASANPNSVGPRSQNRIRRGYFDRLGIAGDSAPVSPTSLNASKRLDMGINARRAAIASARTRRRPPSLKVKLREAPVSTKSQGFFKKLASWMSAESADSYSDSDSQHAALSAGGERFSLFVDNHGSQPKPAASPASKRNGKRNVGFTDSVDVYFIPARTDYPVKVKHALWHTRAEFVDMVMTNMDQVELEMKQEAEARRRLQDLRNNPPPTPTKKG